MCFVTLAPTEKMTVWRDDHIDQLGRGPVFSQQATKDRLEVIADTDRTQFTCGVLPNLVGVTDQG